MHVHSNHRRDHGSLVLLLVAVALLSTACVGATPRTIKIGLVAPFEGRYREIGYDVIPAARLAIREFAARRDHPDVAIELVAYDDAGDPGQAIEQAHKLTVDPEVAIVIGHWRDETTQAALPIYGNASLPLITFSTRDIGEDQEVYNLAPSETDLVEAATDWLEGQDRPGTLRLDEQGDVVTSAEQLQSRGVSAHDSILIGNPEWGLNQFYALAGQAAEGVYFITGAAAPGDTRSEYWTDERVLQFAADFETGSLGTPPGVLSVTAYEATWLAIAHATGIDPAQLSVATLNVLRFDQDGRRYDAPIYLYRWQNGQREFVAELR